MSVEMEIINSVGFTTGIYFGMAIGILLFCGLVLMIEQIFKISFVKYYRNIKSESKKEIIDQHLKNIYDELGALIDSSNSRFLKFMHKDILSIITMLCKKYD